MQLAIIPNTKHEIPTTAIQSAKERLSSPTKRREEENKMKRKGGGGGGGGTRFSGKPAAHAGGGFAGYGQKKPEPTRPSEPAPGPGAGGKGGYGGGSQQSGSYYTQQQRSEAEGQQRAYQRHQVIDVLQPDCTLYYNLPPYA